MGTTGISVGLSGCLFGSDGGEVRDGLEYSESDILETPEGLFEADFYHVNLGEGEWSKIDVEAPGNQAVAIFFWTRGKEVAQQRFLQNHLLRMTIRAVG